MTLNVRHPPPVTCPRCPFFGGVPILVVMEGSHSRSRGVTETLAAAATHAPSDVDAAFEELYRQSRDDVYAYVAGLMRDRSAAEDVTAQAFERAYRRRRRRARLVAEPEDETLVPPHEGAEVAVRRAALRAAIAELSGRERELVALKFFAGLTNGEIG